jgi:hypothetical protein
VTGLRRWFLLLSISAWFTTAALAQATPPPPGLGCAVHITDTPTLRSQGVTEEVGDIIITCSGGSAIPNLGTGASSNPPAPTANITITLKNPITSRLLSSNGVSEALLLIDEPNSGLPSPIPGFGSNEPFTPCLNPTGGCPTYVLTQTGGGGSYQTGVTSSSAAPGSALPRA